MQSETYRLLAFIGTWFVYVRPIGGVYRLAIRSSFESCSPSFPIRLQFLRAQLGCKHIESAQFGCKHNIERLDLLQVLSSQFGQLIGEADGARHGQSAADAQTKSPAERAVTAASTKAKRVAAATTAKH